MRKVLYCDSVGPIGSVGLLLLRLVMGTAFVLHGWEKSRTRWDGWGRKPACPQFFKRWRQSRSLVEAWP